MKLSLSHFELDLAPFFWTVLFTVIVFLAVQVAFKVVLPLIFKGSIPKWLMRLEERVTRMTILTLSLVLVFTLVKTNPVAGSLLVIILVSSAWHYVRNFMSGIMILFSGDLKAGNKIGTGDITGTVVSLGRFDITLRKDNGESARIPYSKLAEQPLISKAPSESAIARTILIELDEHEDAVQAEKTIKHQLTISPWVLAFPAPIVESRFDDNGRITFSITIFGIEDAHLKRVEQSLIHRKLKRA